ncbi:hypothetical protein D187_003680 [Cystobacter fuscus DSM 2262]|uniref:Uncharacterized protein n=1 Tax=Cystobacter fuscus (strain ATCC 25194 / DSM 2262 / NBRC 100088 / M29) TaxID=1242864 RepID=S9QBN1_CYSF2|nr:hypothetical protein D187_003680 [Cystobacter fuscus DSM 2262]
MAVSLVQQVVRRVAGGRTVRRIHGAFLGCSSGRFNNGRTAPPWGVVCVSVVTCLGVPRLQGGWRFQREE